VDSASKSKSRKPTRVSDAGIVMKRDCQVCGDHADYPSAIQGMYRSGQLIPNPTAAEREFVELGWAEKVTRR